VLLGLLEEVMDVVAPHRTLPGKKLPKNVIYTTYDPQEELEAHLRYYAQQCDFHAEQYRRYAQKYQELEATLRAIAPTKTFRRPRQAEIPDIPTDVSDAQWQRVANLLHEAPHPGRPLADPRRVLNGILYVLLHQCAWSKLPKRYGSHITCWRRLLHWQEQGLWQHMIRVLDIPELRKGKPVSTVNGR
jgi:transposase